MSLATFPCVECGKEASSPELGAYCDHCAVTLGGFKACAECNKPLYDDQDGFKCAGCGVWRHAECDDYRVTEYGSYCFGCYADIPAGGKYREARRARC